MCHCLSNTHNTACVQTPTNMCESYVSLSLHHPQHSMCSNSHWKHQVPCVTVSPTPTTRHVFKYPLKTVSPLCHCLSNTHDTTCVQIPTEISESYVSLSFQHPQYSVCSSAHWKQWVRCVILSPTPTTQHVFKHTLKRVSPLCPISPTLKTQHVHITTDKSESYVSQSLLHPQHCAYLLTLSCLTMSKHSLTSVRHTNT